MRRETCAFILHSLSFYLDGCEPITQALLMRTVSRLRLDRVRRNLHVSRDEEQVCFLRLQRARWIMLRGEWKSRVGLAPATNWSSHQVIVCATSNEQRFRVPLLFYFILLTRVMNL